ncbi:MAG: DUF2845 domain-containing protein [Deltaproteobacteria bacterium]|nr:DUF2845 domain-containing protein [Deltaproteobacteria bacterium]
MKNNNIYLIGLTFLVMALGNPGFILAAEETSTMMCDGGVVNIGDTDVDVRDNCGEPDTQGASQWMYDFGPSQTFTVIFKNGKVARILESH